MQDHFERIFPIRLLDLETQGVSTNDKPLRSQWLTCGALVKREESDRVVRHVDEDELGPSELSTRRTDVRVIPTTSDVFRARRTGNPTSADGHGVRLPARSDHSGLLQLAGQLAS